MTKDTKEEKEKKKKARKALLLFLKQLKKKCGSFKKVDEWYAFLKQSLDPIIDQYHIQLPPDALKHFDQAKHLTDTTTEAINKACSNLQWNVEKVAKMLPKHSPILKVLIAGVALTSGVTAAAILFAKIHSVTIVVKNSGCDSINPVSYVPIQIPGLELFDTPIPSGGQGIVKIYPLHVTVDATQKGGIAIGLLGRTMPVNSGGFGASDVRLNGTSLLGKKTDINLGERDTHELVISCQ